MKKLLLVLLILTNTVFASTGSLEFKSGLGEQGRSSDVLEIGIENRIYKNENKCGVFNTYGISYKMMTFEYDSLRVSGFDNNYTHYNQTRKDTTFQYGIGYDFGKVDVSVYTGLGKSNVKTIKMDMQKDNGSYKTVGGSIENSLELRQEFGLKIGYEFGDRDINPYLDISQVSYGSSDSETSIVIGSSFSF